MKTSLFYVSIAFFLCSAPALFAFGKKEVPAKPLQNEQWTLCIAEFDISALPPAQSSLGRVVARNLVRLFNGMQFKLRPNAEYDYYWTSAWLKAQSEAAKKIIEKQNQRDKLVFLGDPAWKIAKQRKKLDEEIAALWETLEITELDSPDIAEKPRFLVTDENRLGNFPKAPAAGKEYFFAAEKKADGILLGKFSEYHGRILVELELWTSWARSVSYRDTVLFSIEDIDLALSEFTARLINSISGMVSATIVVTASPDNAVIVIDDYHAGRGTSEKVERTPGPVNVTVYADNHVSAEQTIELAAGEQVQADFTLRELPSESFTIASSGEEASVYSSGLFAGTTPLMLQGLAGRTTQISIETPSGTGAQTLFTPVQPDTQITLTPKEPAVQGRTAKARKGFYGAVGRLWIIAPLAFLSAGLSNVYVDSFNAAPVRRDEQYQTAQLWYGISSGAMIAAGISLLEVFVRLGIYMYQGNKEGAIFAPKKDESEPAESSADTPAETSPAAETLPQENSVNETGEGNGQVDR